MALTLRPDQESAISALAARLGCTEDELGQQIIDKHLAHERWLAEGVEAGLRDARSGRLRDHAEVVRRFR